MSSVFLKNAMAIPAFHPLLTLVPLLEILSPTYSLSKFDHFTKAHLKFQFHHVLGRFSVVNSNYFRYFRQGGL